MTNRYRRIASAVALSVGLIASVTPAALADQSTKASTPKITSQAQLLNPQLSQPSGAPAYTGPRSEVVSGNGYGTGEGPATIVGAPTPSGGFDWGSAGIGGGAVLGLMLLALIGFRGGTSRSGRHPRRERATAS